MEHMNLTCENHPDLLWHCKAVAISRAGRYTGARNIFFIGHKDHGRHNEETGEYFYSECECPGSALIATDIQAVNDWHDAEESYWRNNA